MKTPLVLLLVLSLAGNAVLAVLSLRSSGPAERSAPPVEAASAVTAGGVATPATTRPAAIASASVPAATWKALKPDGNLRTAIANLRAAGFPPSVVRAVANQLVSEQLGNGGLDHLPFWKQNPGNPEYTAAQRDLGVRRREMIDDLLGADARPSAGLDPASRERRYGQLSDDKIDRIENLNRDINDLRSKLYAERKPGDTGNMMSVQAAAEQEQRAELAAILTPAELEQYEMRTSQSASRLMNNLKGFEVNEAEYAALFRAQKAFDSADPVRTGTFNQESMVLRAVAQEELNEQARAVLSDDRFYEYLKGADNNYARASQFAANYPQITPAMTYELTQIERTYQASMMSMARSASGGGPPPADRMAQMSSARKDYQNKLAALLGQEVATAYTQRNRGGGGGVIQFAPAVTLPGGN